MWNGLFEVDCIYLGAFGGFGGFYSIFQKKTTSPFEMERVKNEIIERVDVDLFKLFCSSACFWTPINFINFKFCPLQYRVIPTIVGGVIWNAYLSFTIHDNKLMS